MKKLKYVIVASKGNAGGTVVLHGFCKYLSDLGENVKIFYLSDFIYRKGKRLRFWLHWTVFSIYDLFMGFLSTLFGEARIKHCRKPPINGCKRKILPFVGRNTVVIYPEITFGNPLRAKKVVRWLLFYNRFYKQKENEKIGYSETDIFYCYRKVFNDKTLNPEEKQLYMTYLDLDTYKKTNDGHREGNCYIIRKGYWRSDLPSEFDGPVIDDFSEKEKVKVLNQSKYCISYDTQTEYSKIAAMCGCISVVVPEPGKTRKDYRAEDDRDYGVAFGFSEEEINYSIETAGKVMELYQQNISVHMDNVAKFVEDCKKHFG